MGENEQQYQIRDKDRNETQQTYKDLAQLKSRECHAAVDNFERTSEA